MAENEETPETEETTVEPVAEEAEKTEEEPVAEAE